MSFISLYFFAMIAGTKKLILAVTTLGFVAVTVGQTFANSLVDVVNNTASGAIATSGEVASGPAGTIVYTIMGIGLVITVVTMLYALKGRSK